MFRKLMLFVCFATTAGCPSAQVVDSTVCDILANPASFDGKIVRIKGTVLAGFDEFAIKDASCKKDVNSIWLVYPEGTKAKAGPAVMITLQLAKNSPGQAAAVQRAPVTLDANKDFAAFDKALSASAKAPGRCLGCVKNTATATLVGRIDAVDSPALERDAKGMFTAVRGFGNLNHYPARLVLQSVTDVAPREIDYTHPAAPGEQVGLRVDPEEVKRAVAAFGAPGEQNGVMISFGGANTQQANSEAKGAADSPDGLLLNVIYGADFPKGPAGSESMAHTGAHIADIRAGKGSQPLGVLEAFAWGPTLASAISQNEKILILPGGYVLWNQSWSDEDRRKLIPTDLGGYLITWAGLTY